MRLVGARDTGGIVGSFGDQSVAKSDLHLRIVALAK